MGYEDVLRLLSVLGPEDELEDEEEDYDDDFDEESDDETDRDNADYMKELANQDD